VQALPTAAAVSDAVLTGRQRIHDLAPRPDIVNVQDNVIQEGQGAIADRTRERLGRTDAPVNLVRKLWTRELRALAEGRPLTQWTRPRASKPPAAYSTAILPFDLMLK
jgi:5,5'-dehydrodivanillate O-demethylase